MVEREFSWHCWGYNLFLTQCSIYIISEIASLHELQIHQNILLCCNTLQIVVFPGGSTGKESNCNVGDLGFIPGLGRSSGEGIGYPLQLSGLENSLDCIVYGVSKSQTWLRDFHFHFLHFCRLSLLILFAFMIKLCFFSSLISYCTML